MQWMLQKPSDQQRLKDIMADGSEEGRRDYFSMAEKGRKLCGQLKSFSWTNPPSHPSLEDLYHVDDGEVEAPRGDFRRTLREWNINSYMKYVEVCGKGHRRRDENPVAYSNRFGKGGMVIYENYKAQDTNPEGQRLWPSEVLWLSYTRVAEKEDFQPSKLRLIGVSHIVNNRDLTAIWHAARSSTSNGHRGCGHREYTSLDEGFYAILGGPNGSSAMRMLIDHRPAIGYREVDRILVRPVDDVDDKARARSYFLILSEPREKPWRKIPSRLPEPRFPMARAAKRRYTKNE
jgi:hypothetical protein